MWSYKQCKYQFHVEGVLSGFVKAGISGWDRLKGTIVSHSQQLLSENVFTAILDVSIKSIETIKGLNEMDKEKH